MSGWGLIWHAPDWSGLSGWVAYDRASSLVKNVWDLIGHASDWSKSGVGFDRATPDWSTRKRVGLDRAYMYS